MDEFIKSLNQDYELVQYRIKDKEVVFHIQSSKKELACPFCGSKTTHVHSIYQREIQDLPIQDKQAVLLVDTRKFFCQNPGCPKSGNITACKSSICSLLKKNAVHCG